MVIVLASSLFFCSFIYSKLGQFIKKMLILNSNIVHRVDDIFGLMGFKTDSQAEKVIKFIVFIILIILNFFFRFVSILVLQIMCGRTNYFAKTVDNLGDQFRPVMHAWLSYIQPGSSCLHWASAWIGQGYFDCWCLIQLRLEVVLWLASNGFFFCNERILTQIVVSSFGIM